MTKSHHECCSHSAQSLGETLQRLDVVEFEGGIWVAARDGERAWVMELLGPGLTPASSKPAATLPTTTRPGRDTGTMSR